MSGVGEQRQREHRQPACEAHRVQTYTMLNVGKIQRGGSAVSLVQTSPEMRLAFHDARRATFELAKLLWGVD